MKHGKKQERETRKRALNQMRKKSARAAFDEMAMSFFLAENVIDGFARGLSRDDFMLRREMAREGAMEEGKTA